MRLTNTVRCGRHCTESAPSNLRYTSPKQSFPGILRCSEAMGCSSISFLKIIVTALKKTYPPVRNLREGMLLNQHCAKLVTSSSVSGLSLDHAHCSSGQNPVLPDVPQAQTFFKLCTIYLIKLLFSRALYE